MQVTNGKILIGRFKHNLDLLQSLTEKCKEEEIRLGVFSVIGAVKNVKLGYYNQETQKYTECVNLDEKLEIVSCMGNVSLKDGEIFVHAHICLADHNGKCYGGHLISATIFASEYYIKELKGAELKREFDHETGLSLWS